MNRMINRAVAVLVVVGILGIAASGVMCLVGARVNTSKSIPIGLYWTSSAPVTKGKYVIFARRSGQCSITQESVAISVQDSVLVATVT